MFECEQCNRPFRLKHHLKQHMARKRPCVKKDNNLQNQNNIFAANSPQNCRKTPQKCRKTPQNAAKNAISERYFCEYCDDRSYKHKRHLNEHYKRGCKKKIEHENTIKQLQEQLAEKNDQIINLLKQNVEQSKQVINDNSSTNCNNTTNNTINLVFNDYGKEDMNFLKTSEKYKRILSKFLANGMCGLQQYIKYKYCNPEQPQNLSIKYTNKNYPDIQVRKDNEWKIRNKHEVMNEIYDKDANVEEILQIYEKINELDDEQDLDPIQERFLNNVNEVFEETEQSNLEVLKSNTLNDFYNCYRNNKVQFKG
tara:strand:- start:3 stop:932 length:930 start_codon:yes stop_codon:yes gene_type:complete